MFHTIFATRPWMSLVVGQAYERLRAERQEQRQQMAEKAGFGSVGGAIVGQTNEDLTLKKWGLNNQQMVINHQ